MANYIYTIDDAKNEINAHIIELKECLAALESITRVTKKEGSDYTNTERNFRTDAKYTALSFEYSAFLSKLRVNYHSNISGYTNTCVYIERGDSAAEIAEKIECEKNKLREQIAKHESGYNAVEKRLKAAEKYLDKLHDILKEAKTDGTNFTLRDYMRNYIDYGKTRR